MPRSRKAPESADRFGWMVAGGPSLGLALVLLFRATLPALEDRRELQNVESRKTVQRRQLLSQAADFVRRRESLGADVQAILVELDRQGIYPEKEVATLRSQLEERLAALQAPPPQEDR